MDLIRRVAIRWGPSELYHGTDEERFRRIQKEGVEPPSYWGTRQIADYYASLGNDAPVILRVPIDEIKHCLEPDVRSVEEPLTYTLGKSEEEVWEQWDWERDDHTWEDSLRATESVKATCRIHPDDFEVVG